jgi:hypothetical protein
VPYRPVQTAHYGLGAFFPAVVLDPVPCWRQPRIGELPERSPGAHELLVLRWCGPAAELDGVPVLLEQTAARAPGRTASAVAWATYGGTLPPHVRLIALRASALIATWSQRPGAGRAEMPILRSQSQAA